jgi:hypothetical protein
MLELCEKGAVIEVEIQPVTPSVAVGGGKRAREGGATVMIDEVVVNVEGEKESLTSVGREELQDDRVAWMAVLSRCVGCMRGRHDYFFLIVSELTKRVRHFILSPSPQASERKCKQRTTDGTVQCDRGRELSSRTGRDHIRESGDAENRREGGEHERECER